jgi:glycine cleavage system H protein
VETEIPADLLYTKEHEYVRREEDSDVVTVGITHHAQDRLGDIVYLDLPTAGAKVTHLDKMGEIESVKAVSELFSPVSGEVVEVNQEAVDSPELVNEEPYGRGWLLKVRLSDEGASELDRLFSPEAYKDLLESEEEED